MWTLMKTGSRSRERTLSTGWPLEEEVAHFGRVAGLLVLSDGSLLLSEDTNGVINKISYMGGE